MNKIKLFALSMLAAVSSFGQLPTYVPTNGLMAAYLFNGNANDLSGNGNNGTLNGPILTGDRFGKANSAFNFDGFSSISVASSSTIQPTNAISVSCWANFSQLTVFAGVVVKRMAINADPFNSFYVGLDADLKWTCEMSRGVAGSKKEVKTSEVVKTNQWYHVCYTYDGSMMKLYVNGRMVGSTQFTGAIGYNSNPLNIGYTIQGSPPFATRGKIDDVYIYDRALTNAEIDFLHRSCKFKLTGQPNSFAANVGETITLSVTSPDPQSTFQWQGDMGTGWLNLGEAGQFSGTKTNKLQVKNFSKSNDGSKFRCVATITECSDTSNEATNLWPVSVTEKLKASIRISPNPFIDNITLAVGEYQGKLNYEIIDMLGNQIRRGSIEGVNEQLINLNEVSAGVLLIRISSEEYGSILTSRIIKR